MSSPSVNQNTYLWQNEPTWPKSEKAVAHTAFDAALKRELQEVMQEAKQMANEIKEPADAWDLEHYLTEPVKTSTANTITANGESSIQQIRLSDFPMSAPLMVSVTQRIGETSMHEASLALSVHLTTKAVDDRQLIRS
jgi:hypothetical protein